MIICETLQQKLCEFCKLVQKQHWCWWGAAGCSPPTASSLACWFVGKQVRPGVMSTHAAVAHGLNFRKFKTPFPPWKNCSIPNRQLTAIKTRTEIYTSSYSPVISASPSPPFHPPPPFVSISTVTSLIADNVLSTAQRLLDGVMMLGGVLCGVSLVPLF